MKKTSSAEEYPYQRSSPLPLIVKRLTLDRILVGDNDGVLKYYINVNVLRYINSGTSS